MKATRLLFFIFLSMGFLLSSVSMASQENRSALRISRPSVQKKTSPSKSDSSSISKASSFPQKRATGLMSKKTGVTFDKALPEDISNENFPDIITGFDFPDATLYDLVKAIGKHTGINFILDNDLRNKRISIIAPSQITVAEAYKAFLSALQVHGYTLVKTGAFWKIQTTEKSHKDNIEVYSGDYFPNTDQLITRIIKLKHINAKGFVDSIKFLLSQSEKIKAHESSNSIIVSDYGSVIEKIMKIVYEMDIPGAEEKIEIIPIDHASVQEVAEILETLLSDKTKKPRGSRLSNQKGRTNVILSVNSQTASTGQVKVSKIISDVRTNSLVVSANKAGLKRVKELIQKIDRRVDPSRIGGVYVYHVLHGTAEDIYNTLMGIQSSTAGSSTSGSSGGRNFRSGGRRPYSSRGPTGGSSSKLFENVTIMQDTNTNSLIISAAKKYEYERVLEVLKKIDVPRDQVFIQAIILEMKINKNKDRSVNLASGFADTLIDNLNDALGTISGDNSLNVDFLTGSVAGFLTDSIGIQDLGKASFGPGLILSQSLNSILGADFKLDKSEGLDQHGNKVTDNSANNALKTSFVPLVRLLNNIDNVNVLSTPQITTLDNVEAEIEIGSNVPVGLKSDLTGSGLSTNSTERADVVLNLKITPRINPQSETVQMQIEQQFDDIGEQNSVPASLRGQAASILKRSIKTEMVLQNGETAVLGGLLSDTNSSGKSKVPLLGDLPLLGWMFRGETTKTEKRNLLVFITPTILKGAHNKQSHRELLNKKIEERIRFIDKYMKGKDPHRDLLDELVPASATVRKQYMEMQDKEEVPEESSLSFFRKKKSPAPAKNKNQPSYTPAQELEELLESDKLEESSNSEPQNKSLEESFDELEIESEEFQEWVETPVEESAPSPAQPADLAPALEPDKKDSATQEDSGQKKSQEPENSDAPNEASGSKTSEEDFIPLDLEDFEDLN